MSALSAGHLGHRALALLHVAMHSPLHWLGALIVALTVAVVWLALRPVRRYSLRKFRGPPLMPVIGNMADVMKVPGASKTDALSFQDSTFRFARHARRARSLMHASSSIC